MFRKMQGERGEMAEREPRWLDDGGGITHPLFSPWQRMISKLVKHIEKRFGRIAAEQPCSARILPA